MTPMLEGVGIALESLRAHKGRAALTILGVAIGVLVGMEIGAIISGFNKGVADILERSGPKTVWVGRFFQGGVNNCEGDDRCPSRHNPPLSLGDPRAGERLPAERWWAVEAGGE